MIDKLDYDYIKILIYLYLIGLSFKLVLFDYFLIKDLKNNDNFFLDDNYEYFIKTNIFVIIFLLFFTLF